MEAPPEELSLQVGQLSAMFQLVGTAVRAGWTVGLARPSDVDAALAHPVLRAVSLLQLEDEALRERARNIQQMGLDWNGADTLGVVGHLCLDGSGGLRSRVLYAASGQVRPDDPRPFTNVVRKAVAYLSGHPLFDQLDDATAEGLGFVLFELFQNSHDYGRQSFNWKTTLSPSLRGVAFCIHKEPLRSISEDALRAAWVERCLASRAQVLELVVFDTGIGLPLGWNRPTGSTAHEAKAPDIPFETEAFRVEQCLQKHRVPRRHFSEAGPPVPDPLHRGMGLFESLEHLSALGGFWEVATARVRLVRDLSANPLLPAERDVSPHGEDFLSLLTRVSPSPLPRAEGTYFTLLVPLAFSAAASSGDSR